MDKWGLQKVDKASWRLSLKLSSGGIAITGGTGATDAGAAAATEEAAATSGIGTKISSNLNTVFINSAARTHTST
jgi:hypothetical protein